MLMVVRNVVFGVCLPGQTFQAKNMRIIRPNLPQRISQVQQVVNVAAAGARTTLDLRNNLRGGCRAEISMVANGRNVGDTGQAVRAWCYGVLRG